MRFRLFLVVAFIGLSQSYFAQVNSLELNPENEKNFIPYMLYRHGGRDGLAEFKKNEPHQYLKELWYFSESFYVKKDHLPNGAPLTKSTIDISRFETARKANEEAIVELPGMKDALVLLPLNQLIYKP